jgi:poly-gamma-glutamate biosynthesis protein PgsC/CapC
MFMTDFYLALFIGLVLSLAVTEIFGVVPGGIIVPGYLALVCETPSAFVLVVLISLITYAIVNHVLTRFAVLYGRRRFVVTIALSVLIKLAFEFLFPIIPFVTFELRGIGIVVPALIANCCFKQGVRLTFASLIPTTLVTFGIVSIIYYFF